MTESESTAQNDNYNTYVIDQISKERNQNLNERKEASNEREQIKNSKAN